MMCMKGSSACKSGIVIGLMLAVLATAAVWIIKLNCCQKHKVGRIMKLFGNGISTVSKIFY